MAFNFGKLIFKIFGSRNERLIRSYSSLAAQAGDFEDNVRSLSDDALRAKTDEFKASLSGGKSPDEILAEAFSVVREAASRNVDMRHFDVQLVGGNVLYDGKIAEMATGEGKTLVATLASYLVHLTGRRVHLVTVNDYLASRDAEWMRPVYEALGMRVGAIQAEMDTGGQERRDQYAADITYGTNNEFGFDYLRDNMKLSIDRMVQGELEYAIIDEVDSILIDEARTPLIISGPTYDDVSRYKKADEVARKLISMQGGHDRVKKQMDSAEKSLASAEGELAEAKKEKDAKRIACAQDAIEKFNREFNDAEAKLEGITQYYETEFDKKSAHLTHDGIGAAQDIAGVGSFFTGSNMEWPHLLEQSLRAHVTYEHEKDYVVLDGKVVIVDEFTGRLMNGRQWSDGLHQAVEAKEGVQVKEESQTLATITLQNFFKLYGQISGMTGTAATEAEEFMNIYGLEVVNIPTNKPCVRDDRDDAIYKTVSEKFGAIVDEIHDASSKGRPVLVGTISIEKSEALSAALSKRYGVEHEVLNAKQHEREASIVEKAGHQHTNRRGEMCGNVTIATNMAGRGTDIKLGEGVVELGGLHILGTERHESRRIDNQLRGRAGRQGDAGSSQFFLSFGDDLMVYFGGERIPKLLRMVGWEEGEPLYHPMMSRTVAKVQRKVEEKNFEVRKSLLEYDEVMDYQRKIFYTRRKEILRGIGLRGMIEEMIVNAIDQACDEMLDERYSGRCIVDWARGSFGVEVRESDVSDDINDVERRIKNNRKNDAEQAISISLGEYLEDFEDPKSWDVGGLSKWAMSSFGVSLNQGKCRQMLADEIEQMLKDAAFEQIDKKDCSQLAEFFEEDFATGRLAEWGRAKFDIVLKAEEIRDSKKRDVAELIKERAFEKYHQREVEYPVEFAMNMVYASGEANVYGFDPLAEWANKKYGTNLSADKLQEMKPKHLYDKLLELSRGYSAEELTDEIKAKVDAYDESAFLAWANERFDCELSSDDIEEDGACAKVVEVGREFMRRELSDLERYVLLQVNDGAWKDHLYTMDHLKGSIWTRSFAEKDPKVEYKREGYRLFIDMLAGIEDKVTDIIFRVHLEAGARERNVWNVSQTSHDEVGQFTMAEKQRAAAQAPQGVDQKVRQIKLDMPKVGRNDSCPCGSGKKYKKCCGKGV